MIKSYCCITESDLETSNNEVVESTDKNKDEKEYEDANKVRDTVEIIIILAFPLEPYLYLGWDMGTV